MSLAGHIKLENFRRIQKELQFQLWYGIFLHYINRTAFWLKRFQSWSRQSWKTKPSLNDLVLCQLIIMIWRVVFVTLQDIQTWSCYLTIQIPILNPVTTTSYFYLLKISAKFSIKNLWLTQSKETKKRIYLLNYFD